MKHVRLGQVGHFGPSVRDSGASALVDVALRLKLEDAGAEIGPEGEGSKNMGLRFHDPDGYRWELSVQA